jgi:uncharacterized surface protein with fasciclin (FAS1) repeats
VHIIDTVLTPTAVSRSIIDQMKNNSDLSVLVALIDFVHMTDIIDRDLPLTMLAPNNKAYGRIATPGSIEDTDDIIRQHIFRGLLFKDVLANLTQVTAINGVTHAVEAYGPNKDTVWVGGACIYEHDILARNGVLHYIDRVIGFDYPTVPPTSSPAPTATAEPTSPTTAPASTTSSTKRRDNIFEWSSSKPSSLPSDMPSPLPSDMPSPVPSDMPSPLPSDMPSPLPSDMPSPFPSDMPSSLPSDMPSPLPSDMPSSLPSDMPSPLTSDMPSYLPSDIPSYLRSDMPSMLPSFGPSLTPSASPSASRRESADGSGAPRFLTIGLRSLGLSVGLILIL